MRIFRQRLWLIILVAWGLIFLANPSPGQKQKPDVHYEPTPHDIVLQMLKMAQVTPNDVVYDLGCGDGRFVITAAKIFGAPGVGVEIDPELIQESKENALKEGVMDKVRFIEEDLFQLDISEATVVTLYLTEELNFRLRPKLLRELRPGTRILSHNFDMADWKPDNTDTVRDRKFYYWIIPADVAGRWRWKGLSLADDSDLTLDVTQTFQKISGKMSFRGETVRIANALLTGDQLSFRTKYKLDGKKVTMHFRGKINPNTIKGSIKIEGGPLAGSHPWTAIRQEERKP